MDIIISLLIVSVLIGIPTWLIVHTVNKADKSTIIYSPEEVRSDSFVCSYTLRPPYGFSIYCSGCSIYRWIYHVFYWKNSGRANDQIH